MLVIKDLSDIAALREGVDIECKLARGRFGQGALPHDVWETYSAFANTIGGNLLLGLEERPDQTYILRGLENASWVMNEFWRGINNPKKVSTNVIPKHLLQVVEIEGRKLIHIYVPPANRQQRPVFIGGDILTGSYIRVESSDIRLSPEDVRLIMAARDS